MQAPSHGWIAPTPSTTNYPMANSSTVPFPFQAKTGGEDGSMEWVRRECMGVNMRERMRKNE
jgi:hypothetical protein